jgi:hypothetical protein
MGSNLKTTGAFGRNDFQKWGLAQWAPHFVDLLMDGVNEVADF